MYRLFMALLTAAEIRKLERQYEAGVSSSAIVEIFQSKGERFSEATLRKYVQLNLLPKSRRVGTRGKHKGSSGVYPVSIIGLINEIKRTLAAGATLDEIRYTSVGLVGEVHALRRVVQETTARFGEAIEKQDDARHRAALLKALDKQSKAFSKQIEELEELANRLKGVGDGD